MQFRLRQSRPLTSVLNRGWKMTRPLLLIAKLYPLGPSCLYQELGRKFTVGPIPQDLFNLYLLTVPIHIQTICSTDTNLPHRLRGLNLLQFLRADIQAHDTKNFGGIRFKIFLCKKDSIFVSVQSIGWWSIDRIHALHHKLKPVQLHIYGLINVKVCNSDASIPWVNVLHTHVAIFINNFSCFLENWNSRSDYHSSALKGKDKVIGLTWVMDWGYCQHIRAATNFTAKD